MQDILSLTYTTLDYTAQIGFCIFTLSARFDFKYGTFSKKIALFKISMSHIPHGIQYTFQLVNKILTPRTVLKMAIMGKNIGRTNYFFLLLSYPEGVGYTFANIPRGKRG